MKIKTILIVIFLTITSVSSISAQNKKAYQELSQKYLSYMSQNLFDEAAKLFHFPSSYTQEKKESEFTSVRNFLDQYKNKLGDIIQILDYVPEADFIGKGVSGAEIEYWSKNQNKSQQIVIS